MADSTDQNEDKKPNTYTYTTKSNTYTYTQLVLPDDPISPLSKPEPGQWYYASEDETNRYVLGTENSEAIKGKEISDYIYAGDKDDLVWGMQLSDILVGQGGNDILIGNSGRDTIDGGVGDDILVGDNWVDTMEGSLKENYDTKLDHHYKVPNHRVFGSGQRDGLLAEAPPSPT